MIRSQLYYNDINENVKNINGIEKLYNKSILITGCTGLICSAIVDTLIFINETQNANIQIYAAARSEDRVKQRFGDYLGLELFTFVDYDVTKEFSFSGKIDYIIHGASNAHPAAYVQQPVETMLSNFYGINNLLKIAKINKNIRVMFISSSEVYGEKDNNTPFVEEEYGFLDILNPRSCYPSSKRAAETLCVSYAKEFELDVVIVRPGHIYGPNATNYDTRVAAQFAKNVLAEEDIVLKSPGLQLRSYTYVFDCASAILTVLILGESSEAYNISNKDSIVSIKELADVFANYAGKKIVYEIPSNQEQKGYSSMQSSALNSDKLEKLGWSGHYSIEKGVKRTLEILKEMKRMNN